MNFRLHIIVLLAGISLAFGQCTQKEIIILSDEKEILTFSLRETKVTTQWDGQTLYLISHEPVDISKPLTPDITVSKDAILYPSSGTPQIFSELGVKYVVTAQSGNSKEFFVKLRVLSSDKEILSFSIPNKTTHVVRNENTIDIEVYAFVDVTNLTPIITCSPNATVSPKSGEMIDFSYPITYTVTAQDGSTADYTVTVTKSLSRRNEIESFELIGTQQIYEREGDNLFIYVPYETDVTNIETNIVVSDMATVSPENGAFVDFTNPQIYTVTASDGEWKNYLVTVKRSPWRLLTANPAFSTRDDLFLCEMNDQVYMYRGWLRSDPITGPLYSTEIWKSSDMINWIRVTDNIPWLGTDYFRNYQSFIKFNGKVWVYGGGSSGLEIWSSSDGENFVKSDVDIPFGRRYWPYFGVLNDKLWLTGGLNWWDDIGNYIRDGYGVLPYNDMWSSTDGETWVQEKSFSQMPPRGMINGYVNYNGKLLVIGGGISNGDLISSYNDIWSSNDGINWKRMVIEAAFPPTTYHSIINKDGRLFLVMGDIKNQRTSNLSWYSDDGGYSWKQIKYGFYKERHASGIINFKGRLYLVAGFNCRDVWILDEERL